MTKVASPTAAPPSTIYKGPGRPPAPQFYPQGSAPGGAPVANDVSSQISQFVAGSGASRKVKTSAAPPSPLRVLKEADAMVTRINTMINTYFKDTAAGKNSKVSLADIFNLRVNLETITNKAVQTKNPALARRMLALVGSVATQFHAGLNLMRKNGKLIDIDTTAVAGKYAGAITTSINNLEGSYAKLKVSGSALKEFQKRAADIKKRAANL